MKKKKYGNEFKVGLFFIICVIGLLYLTFRTGKINIRKTGYNIYAVFQDIAGLETKAPVMLNGLEVGKVDDVNVSYEGDKTKIVLKLYLDQTAKIRTNATVSIKTLGLMGEKFIQISSTEGESFIEPDTYLAGEPYKDMDTLMNEATTLTEHLNSIVEDNKSKINEIVDNAEAMSQNLEEMSEDLRHNPWKLLFRTKEKK